MSENERERWGSKASFIMASVGAAVGFGNVWRFPSLAYEYGGGAFFIPYLMALIFIGIPLAILEIAMGQYHQTGDVGVFGSVHDRLKGVGLGSVMCAWFVVCYYAPLIAWVINAFFDSFGDTDWEAMTGDEAYVYFKDEVVGGNTLGEDKRPTRLVGANVGYIALTWFVIWLCLAFGIKNTGRIAYFTMGLPIILIFVFLGRAVSLEGSSAGIKAYIGVWDMTVLTEKPDCWSRAVSQIFFSIGVTFGILTAFGSYCPRDWPAVKNAVGISVCNSTFSFVAGFAVFAGLGHLAYLKNPENPNVADVAGDGGPGLLFGTYPVILATLPGGVHWVRLLFFTLFLLGIDSAFAFTDAVVTCVHDTTFGQNTKKIHVVTGTCFFGFIIGLLYATDAGFWFLDVVDFYINFLMILVGFFECFALGWVAGLDEQCETLGTTTMAVYMFTTFGSVITASGVWFGAKSLWGGFVTLIVFYVIGMGVTMHLLKKVKDSEPERWTWKSILFALTFKNIDDYTKKLEEKVGHIPSVWGFLIKHFIPPILLIMFALGASAKNDDGKPVFGYYGGYVAWPFQVMGILIVALAAIAVLVSFAAPGLYWWTFVPQVKDDDEIKKKSVSHQSLSDEGGPEDEKEDTTTNKEVEVVEVTV